MTRNTRIKGLWLGVTAAAALGALTVSAQQKPAAAADPQAIVNAAHKRLQTLKVGKNADYIPALAKVDPNLFGIALITVRRQGLHGG